MFGETAGSALRPGSVNGELNDMGTEISTGGSGGGVLRALICALELLFLFLAL